jgi:hypothetical protein
VLLHPLRLRRLLTAVGSAVQTDAGLGPLRFAAQFARIASGEVRFTTIPILGTPTIQDTAGNDVSIVAVDTAALPGFIARVTAAPQAAAPSAAQPTSAPPSAPPSGLPPSSPRPSSFSTVSCVR